MIYVQDGNKTERDKYNEIWEIPEYSNFSPGFRNVERFMKVIDPKEGETIIDIGCGQGIAGLEFEKLGLRVWYLDLVKKQLKSEVDKGRFIESPIWGDWRFPHSGRKWDYGFCCDVMEHIPEEYTMLCLDRIVSNCKICWILISLIEEGMGLAIGETLHMTVRSFDWWLMRLGTLGKVLDARDLLNGGLYVVTK